MQLEYLETLVAAVAAGSFSRAAESLCLTQSAVSKRIRFLEEHYGYPLVDRSGPVLAPTPAGALVLEKARHLLAIERELEEGLDGLNRHSALSFCCTPGFGVAHLPGVMRRLILHDVDMSRIRFLFDTPDDILRGVSEERYDVAVAEHCTPPELEGFRTFSLPADEMLFVSAPSLRLPAPRIPIESLCAQTLLHRREACCSRIFLDANLARIGCAIGDFRRAVLIDDLHLILEAAVRGDGVAFVSGDVVAEAVRERRLVTHHVDGFLHRRERTLVVPERRAESPAVAAVVEAVLEVFESSSPALAAGA